MVGAQAKRQIHQARIIFILACLFSVVSAALFADNSSLIVVEENETEVALIEPESLEESGGILELEEVVLGEDSTLILPPFQSIVIQNLIAHEGAKIQLAQPDASEGKSPSARFMIRRIRGHIVLESRGLPGRNGRDGAHGRQGRDGERGRDARTLIFGLIWLGNGEDGRAGYPGEDGSDGEDGTDGGEGGDLSLYYQDKEEWTKIAIDVAGGEAGQPGKAGQAGMGGNGGMGGRGWKSGDQGPLGISGISGRPGKPGKPGLPGKASLYQLPQNLFSCLMTLDARSLDEELLPEDYEACADLAGTENSFQGRTRTSTAIISATTDPLLLIDMDGTLYFNADGQDGRNARPSWTPELSAEAGSNGANGGHLTLLFRQLPAQVFITAQGGNGGNGVSGKAGRAGADGKDGRDGGLFRSATDGENGSDGEKGGDGSSGGHGGNGGKIRIIYIPEDNEFYDAHWSERFQVVTEQGLAGKAGQGAPGGRAGVGGRGGKHFWSSKRDADGKPGLPGANGQNGQDGQNGEEGQVEFFEADSLGDWIVEEFRLETERLQILKTRT